MWVCMHQYIYVYLYICIICVFACWYARIAVIKFTCKYHHYVAYTPCTLRLTTGRSEFITLRVRLCVRVSLWKRVRAYADILPVNLWHAKYFKRRHYAPKYVWMYVCACVNTFKCLALAYVQVSIVAPIKRKQ